MNEINDKFNTIVNLLTEKNKKDLINDENLIKYSKENNIEKLRELLRIPNINLNIQNNNGETALYLASQNGNKKCIRLLIKAGADVNIQDNRGDTALNEVSRYSNTECIRVLIKAGADLNIQNKDGDTALHYASCEINTECTEILIKAGADVNIQDNDGKTALQQAYEYDHKKILDIFKKYNHIPEGDISKNDIIKKNFEEIEKKITELMKSFKNELE